MFEQAAIGMIKGYAKKLALLTQKTKIPIKGSI